MNPSVRRAVGVWMGLAVLSAGAVAMSISSKLTFPACSNAFWTIAASLAAGLITAVTITVFAVRFRRQLAAAVHDLKNDITTGARKTGDRMRLESELLSGAVEHGIEAIFVRTGHGAYKFIRAARHELRAAFSLGHGEVLVLCVAAPALFRPGELGDILRKGLTRASNTVGLRVLLLDPKSDWTDHRARLEPLHPTRHDIASSLAFLKTLAAQCPGRVIWKTYTTQPTMFLIVTDTAVFCESYPLFPSPPDVGPLGGAMPLILARRGSETYRRCREHFEYMWKELTKSDTSTSSTQWLSN